jgi:hypothetical protein
MKERRHGFSDLRGINNYIKIMPLFSKDAFPPWLRDRQDFLKLYFTTQI